MIVSMLRLIGFMLASDVVMPRIIDRAQQSAGRAGICAPAIVLELDGLQRIDAHRNRRMRIIEQGVEPIRRVSVDRLSRESRVKALIMASLPTMVLAKSSA